MIFLKKCLFVALREIKHENMKMKNAIISALAVAAFMIGVHQAMTIGMDQAEKTDPADYVGGMLLGIKASYFLFMISTGLFFWMKYDANKQKLKEKEAQAQKAMEQETPTRKRKSKKK